MKNNQSIKKLYIILHASNPDTLSDMVEDAILNDYQPVGGVSFWISSYYPLTTHFSQSMQLVPE